jgi:hypothetical protein
MPSAGLWPALRNGLTLRVVGKIRWLAVAGLVLLVAAAGAGVTGFILAGVALGVPYLLGCVFHPRTTHRACRGTGYHRSAWYPWSTRRCRGCVGGLQVRHGARAVGLPHVRQEHARRTRTIVRNRQQRTWR